MKSPQELLSSQLSCPTGTEEGPPPAICQAGVVFDVADGAVLYRQREPSDSIYYLASGAVSISVTAEGKETITGVQSAGTFFGARSLDVERHATTAKALLPSVVVRVPKAIVKELLETDLAFARSFARHMMRRMAMLEEEQVDRSINPTRKRLARLLLILASHATQGDEAQVLERMNEDVLAQIIGADPSSIRTLLDDFRRARHVAPGEPLAVRSSLVQVLLPTQRADTASQLDDLPWC